MPQPNPGSFDWIAETDYAEAGTVTLVVGPSADACRKIIGAEPPTVLATLSPHSTGTPLVIIVPLAESNGIGAILIENNGFEGSRAEVLAALSKKGKAASAYWNVNGDVRFACAARGKAIASVDLSDVEGDELPARLAAFVRRHRSQYDGHPALAMALVEQFTGVQVTATELVRQPSMAHRIVTPINGLPITPQELLDLQYPSPALVTAVLAAHPQARWQLAEWAASKALDATGLRDEPSVAAFLDNRSTPRPMTPELSALRSAAERRLTSLEFAINSPEGTEQDRQDVRLTGKRHWAMQSLAYLAQPDDVAAALGAAQCADIVVANHLALDEDTGSPFIHEAERLLHSLA